MFLVHVREHRGVLRKQKHPRRKFKHTERAEWTALPHAFADANYSTYGVGITVENFRDSFTRCPSCS